MAGGVTAARTVAPELWGLTHMSCGSGCVRVAHGEASRRDFLRRTMLGLGLSGPLIAEMPSLANGGRAPDGTWTLWRLKQGVV